MKCFFNECVGEGQIPVSYQEHRKKFDEKRFEMKTDKLLWTLNSAQGNEKEELHTLILKTSKMIEPSRFPLISMWVLKFSFNRK